MLQEWFEIIEAAASSTHAALIISLSLNVALAWGWWRREQGHVSRYDQIRGERTQLENTFLERLREREDEVAAIGREAFAVLQDVAAALAGMERTLDGVEALVHMALDNKLRGGCSDDEK